jgi:hypothetical protein
MTCTAGHLSCVRRASTRPILFGRRLRVPPCPYLWADVCPPHDRRMYAIVFAIVLQCFPSTPPACAGWTSRAQATAPLPAAPRRSTPSPALPFLRVLRARAPVRTPVTRHVPLVPRAMLHGMPVVAPTACPPPGAPALSTMPVGAGSRSRAGTPACPRVRCRHRPSVQGCAEGVLAYFLEHEVRTYRRPRCVPTGDAPRTYGRPRCVPTGDAPRTYGRRFSPEVFLAQTLRHARL